MVESQALSDPSRHALLVYPTTDRTLLLFQYEMAGARQFELVHADGTGQAMPLMGLPQLPQDDTVSVLVGTIGPSRLYLEVRDTSLHIVTVDGSGAAVNTQVSVDGETSYDCINCHEPDGPADKAIYQDLATRGLVLLDLSAPVARRVTKLMPADGSRLRCPLWSADGKSFAYTESDDTHTRIYRVSWPGADPAQPEMLHQAEGMIVLLVLRP